MKFNINHNVKVRLTGTGVEILKAHHEDLERYFPKIGPFVPPKEDGDGFSKWQLWDLMHTFGPYIQLGGIVPFETEIEIIEDNP